MDESKPAMESKPASPTGEPVIISKNGATKWFNIHWKRCKMFTLHNYTHFHICVFILTFLAYAFVHANRKSFSNVKALVSEEWTPISGDEIKNPTELWHSHQLFTGSNAKELKAFLGTLDTAFMVIYALSMYVGGYMGDRIDLRIFLCFCMWGASLTVVAFACVSEWLGLYSMTWYIIFWMLNAAFQGPIWPCILAIMGQWFGKSGRGFILGLWSSNASVGNIIGSLIVARYVDFGYDVAVLVPAVVMFCFTIALFFGLVVSPCEVNLPLPDSEPGHVLVPTDEPPRIAQESSSSEEFENQEDTGSILKEIGMVQTIEESQCRVNEEKTNNAVYKSKQHHELRAIGFLEALLLPGVIWYSFAYAALKLVNYAFFFWLPYYLNRQFHWSQADADDLSIWYDVGGIIGAVLGGLASDKCKRAPVMFAMIGASIPTLIFYNNLPANMALNGFVLFVLGFFVGGVANLLSSAVAADLGRHPSLSSSKSALATVSGIIDGTGSAGAALGQMLIPLLEVWAGWSSVFYMLVVCLLLTLLGIGRMLLSEFKSSFHIQFWRCFCCVIQRKQQSKANTHDEQQQPEKLDNGVWFNCKNNNTNDEANNKIVITTTTTNQQQSSPGFL